jgi:LmbE family N-acetylglucosaminyl deacetylase
MKRISKLRSAALFLLAGLAVAGSFSRAGHRNAYPLPEERGTAGILNALEKLPVFVRVLHTTAHPDDESAGTLTWLARKMHARTALFSLTRGDGGQNVLGDEKYEAMGLVRTGELLEACRVYGVETYFSTVFEFGFSKSAQETLRVWGHEATLEEVVRFIRTWKPAIVISKWLGNSRDGHGHHQAAGLLTVEAFRAAGDPSKFPAQLQQGLPAWQPKKLYLPARDDSAAGNAQGTPADGTVRINIGEYDPLLGRSYREIGSEGYSKHRSQGNGARFSLPGRGFDNFKLADSTVGTRGKEDGFFDSIDRALTSIAELAGPDSAAVPWLAQDLAAAKSAAESCVRAFRPREPEASAEQAVRGLAILTGLIQKVESSELPRPTKELLHDALTEKRTDFQDAVNAALGIYLTAGTEEATAVPGQEIAVTVQVFNRGGRTIDLKRVTLWTPDGWVSALPAGAPLGKVAPGESASFKHNVQIPPGAKITEPFWYRENKHDSRYKTRPTRNVFAPFDPPEITAQATYRYNETEVSISAPARAQAGDPIRGVDFVDFQVVPALSVALNPDLVVIPAAVENQTREFQVSVVSNGKSPLRGQLEILAPQGWTVEPASAPFSLSRKEESFTVRFNLRLPPGDHEGNHSVDAIARTANQEFRRGYRVISYPENWTRHLYSPSRAEVKIFDVKVAPNPTVGYIMGAGDEVPASLQQLGVKVEMLSAKDLAFGELSRFSAIVTGIRAYNINEDLRANNQRLLKYVEQGGTLIVQYNTPIGRGNSPFPYGPFAMSSSAGDHITVEDSPVKILEPQHPILSTPNKITLADFEGWVQERGLYFMTQWDSRYTPLISGNDPEEKPSLGGFLVARHGKGYYIFTGYAWFRQLPAGVPGAFRIFANMLSLGKN